MRWTREDVCVCECMFLHRCESEGKFLRCLKTAVIENKRRMKCLRKKQNANA